MRRRGAGQAGPTFLFLLGMALIDRAIGGGETLRTLDSWVRRPTSFLASPPCGAAPVSRVDASGALPSTEQTQGAAPSLRGAPRDSESSREEEKAAQVGRLPGRGGSSRAESAPEVPPPDPEMVQMLLEAARAGDTVSPSLELKAFSQRDMLGVRYTPVSIGAGKRPGSPNWCTQIDSLS